MNEPSTPPELIGEGTDPLHQSFTAARLYAHQVETGEPISTAAASVMLGKLPRLRDELDRIERTMTETLLDWGASWEDVAAATGRSSKQAAQQRYTRLGGTRRWPTRRPAEALPYAGVDAPGMSVPEAKRAWSRPWSDYRPVDITPPELRPDALAVAVPTWAEGYVSPDEITDWPQRQNDAVIPFDRDARGWPLHPHGRTGRAGRNLGRWGENAAADPIVVADGHVLLIQRSDIQQWAIPGGMVDAGETAPAALTRELAEETGVDLTAHTPEILARQVVDDWRQTDHAWVASTAALYQLPEQVAASGADDALEARWFPFADLATLEQAVADVDGQLYDAHRPLLTTALARLDRS